MYSALSLHLNTTTSNPQLLPGLRSINDFGCVFMVCVCTWDVNVACSSIFSQVRGEKNLVWFGEGKHGLSLMVHPRYTESRLRNWGFKLNQVSGAFFLGYVKLGLLMDKLYCVNHVLQLPFGF